jgi:hypothetical protein
MYAQRQINAKQPVGFIALNYTYGVSSGGGMGDIDEDF